MHLKQYLVDAFADRLFTGNPAAVCYAPSWPPDQQMQKIALENNLSETAFVVPEGERYGIRWFTPKYEIDLCGHATLATAFVLHSFLDPIRSPLVFRSQSGELTVTCADGVYTLDFPSRPAAPIKRLPAVEVALGLPIQEAYLSRDLMVVLEREDQVAQLTPDFTRLSALEIGDGVIVTAPGTDCDFVSRCFYPKCGVNEDPVTGSAHCNLIPYWADRLCKRRLTAKQLSERGGTLYCEDFGTRVHISGSAVLYAVADLNLDNDLLG